MEARRRRGEHDGEIQCIYCFEGGKRQIELSKCACLLDIAADTAAFYQSFLPLVFICWLCGWVGRVGSRGGREGRQKKTINQCKHNESINK